MTDTKTTTIQRTAQSLSTEMRLTRHENVKGRRGLYNDNVITFHEVASDGTVGDAYSFNHYSDEAEAAKAFDLYLGAHHLSEIHKLAATTAVADCPECTWKGLDLLEDGGAICPNCDRWWSDAAPLVR